MGGAPAACAGAENGVCRMTSATAIVVIGASGCRGANEAMTSSANWSGRDPTTKKDSSARGSQKGVRCCPVEGWTADVGVPYGGGTAGHPPATISGTASRRGSAAGPRRNGCSPSPVESVVAADVQRVEYSDCASGADIVLYTVEGGGTHAS